MKNSKVTSSYAGEKGGASRFFYCAKNQKQSVIDYLSKLIKMPGDMQEILKLNLN